MSWVSCYNKLTPEPQQASDARKSAVNGRQNVSRQVTPEHQQASDVSMSAVNCARLLNVQQGGLHRWEQKLVTCITRLSHGQNATDWVQQLP